MQCICLMYLIEIHEQHEMGGDQNLDRRNLERPVIRNFETANIKIKTDELFHNFIFELFFHFLEII